MLLADRVDVGRQKVCAWLGRLQLNSVVCRFDEIVHATLLAA